VRIGADWCGLVWIGVDWCGLVRIGADWCGLVWIGVDWCGLSQARHRPIRPLTSQCNTFYSFNENKHIVRHHHGDQPGQGRCTGCHQNRRIRCVASLLRACERKAPSNSRSQLEVRQSLLASLSAYASWEVGEQGGLALHWR